MNHYNGRLILKVKKRRNSIPLPSKKYLEEKENRFLTPQVKSLKRPNPFSKQNNGNEKSKRTVKNVLKEDFKQGSLLSDLSSFENECHENSVVNVNSIYCIKEVESKNNIEVEEEKVEDEKSSVTYESPQFPLSWTVKQKVKFLSSSNFNIDLKPSNEPTAIHQFTKNSDNDKGIIFNQFLYNWIHPVIPGIPNYPLKTTILGKSGKDEKQCINMLANNVELQAVVMKQWRTSFQSLFNMLKSSYCPYFFFCGHQFTVLFKALGVGTKSATAVLGPTTKGLRDLLTQEGLNFEFVCKTNEDSVDEIEFGFEEEAKLHHSGEDSQQSPSSLNTSCDEDFFDSIGLNKKEHFPHMEQQERKALRSQLNRLDKRPESVIKIKNCNGLFNFLLNATFLCTPAGPLTGLPPTLLSPCSFEGATLNKNKINTQPVKQMKKSTTSTINTVDISGYVLPCQLYNICNMLTQGNEKITIHTKTFESMKCFVSSYSTAVDSEEEEPVITNNKNLPISDDLFSHLNQNAAAVNDATEIKFNNGNFSF